MEAKGTNYPDAGTAPDADTEVPYSAGSAGFLMVKTRLMLNPK